VYAAERQEDNVKVAELEKAETERKHLAKRAGSDNEGAGQGQKRCSKIQNVANVTYKET
jgi:hypothetical protein